MRGGGYKTQSYLLGLCQRQGGGRFRGSACGGEKKKGFYSLDPDGRWQGEEGGVWRKTCFMVKGQEKVKRRLPRRRCMGDSG